MTRTRKNLKIFATFPEKKTRFLVLDVSTLRYSTLFTLHRNRYTVRNLRHRPNSLPKLLWRSREPKQLRFQRRLRAENLSNLKNVFAKNHLKS